MKKQELEIKFKEINLHSTNNFLLVAKAINKLQKRVQELENKQIIKIKYRNSAKNKK